LAAGVQLSNAGGTDSGNVIVFKLNGDTWQSVRQDINGLAALDRFGYSISLTFDGSRIACSWCSGRWSGGASKRVRRETNLISLSCFRNKPHQHRVKILRSKNDESMNQVNLPCLRLPVCSHFQQRARIEWCMSTSAKRRRGCSLSNPPTYVLL
jgi:hypothetical protein